MENEKIAPSGHTRYKSDLPQQVQGCIDELNKLSEQNHMLAKQNLKLNEELEELRFRIASLEK